MIVVSFWFVLDLQMTRFLKIKQAGVKYAVIYYNSGASDMILVQIIMVRARQDSVISLVFDCRHSNS